MPRKTIFALCGSTRRDSVNLQILRVMRSLLSDEADVEIFDAIDTLPHFNPDIDRDPLPPAVALFRSKIAASDGFVVCTPEYVFSLPGSLKNAIEWLVSTTLLTDKPAALITASSSGRVAHESLELVMRTVGAQFGAKASLLISSPKTKIGADGSVTDDATHAALRSLASDLLQRI